MAFGFHLVGKIDQQDGKTNAGTKADTTDKNTKKEEVK
jgi:hypothetical protein